MKTWQIADELEQIYRYHSCDKLKEIADDGFRYISDFEELPPLTASQYEEHLKKQLDHYRSLEIQEKRVNKRLIEIVLQEDLRSPYRSTDGEKSEFYPFLEPRLLQCKVENGKITEIHLCDPKNKKIPENIQTELLECCKRSDLDGAAAAIRNGAYAADCRDEDRFCISYAAESGSVELCRLLIEDEADIRIMCWDTLFYAVENPDVEVFKYLLRQEAPADIVTCFAGDDLPMTPLDYARHCHNESAEKILLESGAPTFEELKEWCFKKAGFRIPWSDKGGEMSVCGVGDEVNEYAGLRVSHSNLCFGMELEYFCTFVIPFFIKYFPKQFEPYLEDNLVTFDDAEKGLCEISDFIGLLKNDFDNPKVTELLSHWHPGSFVEWGERNSWVTFYFSDEENHLLWKTHRGALIDFYRELHTQMNAIIEDAKNCGDKYLSFVGP